MQLRWKTIAIGLLLAAGLAVTVGCGGDEDTGPQQTPTNLPEGTVKPPGAADGTPEASSVNITPVE